MTFEAIETAFELLLENVQTIENDLDPCLRCPYRAKFLLFGG